MTRPCLMWLTTLSLLTAVACDRESATSSNEVGPSRAASLADIPSDQSRSGWTQREQYFVELTPRPNPIPFQQLFELEVRIWESEEGKRSVDSAEIDDVRARMPAHDHGMKTAPETRRTAPGEFEVRGMRFHMQGRGEDGNWVIELVVDGAEGVDRATFEVQCCRPGS